MSFYELDIPVVKLAAKLKRFAKETKELAKLLFK